MNTNLDLSRPALAYRPEIDGLRAFAVLSVCLFHAGLPWVSGGFIGVDVFFVISGYLITGIIQSNLAAGTFSIADFYARRARRILPALFVVLAACSLAGYFLMLPSELKMLGRHVAATALFVSNISFFRESGYFDLSAELKPLLMTWSLGVEEQFYIVWPLLLWVAARKRWVPLHLVTGVLLLSLAGASWAVHDHLAGTFFLLPSRAWELALGAVLALRPPPAARAGNWRWELAGAVGLLAILGSALAYDENTTFPAYGALLPCLGAALILIVGQRARATACLLTNPPMRWVGRISYSLYLWHWPLFAFARLLLNGELPARVAVPLLLLALVLAHLTWLLVEQRWRHAGESVPRTLKAYGIGLLACVLLAAGLIGVSKAAWRTGDEVRRIDAASKDVNSLQALCHLDDLAQPAEPAARCRQGAPGRPVLFLWGDSHADAVAPGFAALAQTGRLGFTQFTKSGCPPLPGLTVNDSRGNVYESCRQFNEQALAYVLAHPEIEVVALVARWSIYAAARHGVERGKPDVALATAGEGFVAPGVALRHLDASLGDLLHTLRAAGKRIVLLTQPADPGFNVPQCWARRSMLGGWAESFLSCDLDYSPAWARIEPANAIVRRLAGQYPGIRLVDAASTWCSPGHCLTGDLATNRILYFDDDHLSRSAGIALLQDVVLPEAVGAASGHRLGKEEN